MKIATWQSHRLATLGTALITTLGSFSAIAEPYSGTHTQEPIVRIVSWSLILLGCLFVAFPIAVILSKAKLRTQRFVISFFMAFIALLTIGHLANVMATVSELVSLVLQILL
jgi:uncharacterized integral membrane protein